MRSSLPGKTDIVLLGGGHAHVHVLTALARQPPSGARLTLVTRDLSTPYSGMLPGVVAGLYRPEQAHIDIVKLAEATGASLIHADAIGIDRARKLVLLSKQAPIAYDLLSINVGITPALGAIEGAAEHGIAVKPIGAFLEKFEVLRTACRQPNGPRRIVVVGAGAGGVELLLSIRARLRAEAEAAGARPDEFSFALITAEEILATHNTRVRMAFRRILRERDVRLFEHRRVARLRRGAVEMQDGAILEADGVLVTTQAAAPAWFEATGLALDPGGFIAVGPTLQVLNDPDVFAVGDCATLIETPREKSGVYAVRSGPPLAENLRRRARGAPPLPWRPQARALSLISTGERYAIASRGPVKVEGRWVWHVKNWIDRRWIAMYRDVEPIRTPLR